MEQGSTSIFNAVAEVKEVVRSFVAASNAMLNISRLSIISPPIGVYVDPCLYYFYFNNVGVKTTPTLFYFKYIKYIVNVYAHVSMLVYYVYILVNGSVTGKLIFIKVRMSLIFFITSRWFFNVLCNTSFSAI